MNEFVQTADADLIRMAQFGDNQPMFDTEGDKKLHVVFRMDAWHNDAKSREENRPIFEMVEFIKIMVPGDKDCEINRPVTDEDRLRFSDRYDRFKRNVSQVQGTPLSEETWLSKAQVEELRFFNVQTLEQLAGMPDVQAQKFMGIQQLKRKAQERMELIKAEAPVNELQGKINAQSEIIETQKMQIEQMVARLTALEASAPAPKSAKVLKE